MAKGNLAAEMVALVRKQFGRESALLASGEKHGVRSEVTDVIPTNISPLDHYVLGIGGLPAGRLVEVFSEEGGGKTSFVLNVCGSAQHEGGLAVLQETEESFNIERARTFGVNTDELLVLQPSTMEECIDQQQFVLAMIEKLKPAGPSLLAWDSIAATPTRKELDFDFDADGKDGEAKNMQDMRAKLLSQACRQLPAAARGARTCLLYVNQVREKIGVMFGDKTTTPGGKAVKFASSIRLQIMGGKAVKRKEEHVGKDVLVMAVKNKLAAPWRKTRVRLMYETGFDEVWSTLEYAKDREVVADEARGAKAYDAALKALEWPRPNIDPPAKEVIETGATENGEEVEKPDNEEIA